MSAGWGAPRERALTVLAAAARLVDPNDPLGRLTRERVPASSGLSAEGVELALTRVETGLSRREWSSLSAAVPPAGRVHVVLAANVFVAAVRALVLAAVAAPSVAVRPSRRDPAFAALLVRALGEAGVGPGAVSTRDERPIAGDWVHGYGRDETLAALRAKYGEDTPMWFHGAGFGLAVARYEGDARAIAEDVVVFDQRGCLSPRVVLFEGDEGAGASFAARLADELAGWRGRAPPGARSPDESAALARYRDTMAVAGDVFGDEGALVGFDPAPRALTWPAAPRAVHVAIVREASDATALVGPLVRGLVCLGGEGATADALASIAPGARRSPLGAMQRPPLDGPVDRRAAPPPFTRAAPAQKD